MPSDPVTGRSGILLIVDTSDIREGKLEDIRTAMKTLVAFARANEPRLIAYDAYLNEDETRLTVLQAHPDSASAEYHMNVAASLFSPFTGLIRMREIDVYGEPGPALLDKLYRKAALLGGAEVVVHKQLAGFSRFGNA